MLDAPESADYRVKFETLSLGGLDYRIRSLLDRQQYSDPDDAAEQAGISSASWPLFGMVWPSARILAEDMQGFEIEGKRILEIGCGLALASLVLQRRGGNITASDIHPMAAGFLTENLRLNGLSPIRFRTGSWADTDPDLGEFDLIIGSDLLYERDQPEILSGFIGRHSRARVEVVIVDPDRGNRPRFNRSMVDLGFVHDERRAGSHLADGAPYKGRVLKYRRG
jgi:predicted nicotinamide N-methyase